MTYISTLAVRVVTSSDFGAGTDNDVYFDVGPLGWKLSSSDNDFESGSDRTYDLDLHGLELDTDELVWLRLQKKGVGGVLGTTDLPDGEWRPESIHVIVNGQEFTSRRVDVVLHNDALGTSRWNWISLLSRYDHTPGQELFVRSLRMLPNNALQGFDEDIAVISTNLFKNFGISGWLGTGLPRATAIGTVLRTPGESTDGLATIDLRLEAIEIDGSRYFVDGRPGISLQRYLRVEYKFRRSAPFPSGEEFVPANGQRMRISGEVKWDSDQEGWYEIHPAGRGDLEWLDPPPKIINLTSTFSEVLGPPETGVVHWPGCNVKGTPKDWGARDFTFQKILVTQLYEIGVVVQNPGTNTMVLWTVNGQPLLQGDGTLEPNNVPVSYNLKDLHLRLLAPQIAGDVVLHPLLPQSGSGATSFDLQVRIDDAYQPTSRSLAIFFDTIRITYEADYYRIVGGCSAARFVQNQKLKTIPQVIPHYDRERLAELDEGVLVGIVGEITKEHGLSSAWREAAQVANKGQLVNTVLVLSVRYPATAGKVIPGRTN